jgi:putative tricarboxylic transport membrane protein
MNIINRDSITALILLMLCGLFLNALGDIEQTHYGTVGSDVWPTIVLSVLTFFCSIYFVTSLRDTSDEQQAFSWKAFLPKNVLIVFALFALFVYSLPTLGMLVGGISFVFLALTLIGHKTKKHLILHFIIAFLSVALMWATFTYGLNVMLPQGDLIYWLLN